VVGGGEEEAGPSGSAVLRMGKRHKPKPKRRRPGRHGPADATRHVVGFFALDHINALCDGDACVVCGTAPAMHHFVEQRRTPQRGPFRVQATTFGEIWQGLQLGAAYALDPAAYQVFRPLAHQAGLTLPPPDVAHPDAIPVPLRRVQLDAPAPERLVPTWADEEGVHTLLPGPLDAAQRDRLSRVYQEHIRHSPIWEQMVREFGPARAEELLREFRVEQR
jgi:hypothetical protein